MTIEEKLEKIAETEIYVHNAGYLQGQARLAAELDAVYDIIEYNGGTPLTDHRPQAVYEQASMYWAEFANRTDFTAACRDWKSKYIYPQVEIKPTYAPRMFFQNENIVEIGDIDFSGVTDNSVDTGGCASAMSYCPNLRKVGTLDISHAGVRSMFNTSQNLHTIKRLIVTEDTYFHFTFDLCDSLQTVIFEGTIGNPNGVTNDGGLRLHCSPLLSADSARSIMECLKDYSGTDEEYKYSVKLHAEAWQRLESTYQSPNGGTWKEYAVDKGWNV